MSYLVAYAKVIIEKEDIKLQGVYYGGMGETREEAEFLAKDCVNNIKGGTIMPRIVPLDNYDFIDAMYDITDRFERIVNDMVEMNKTLLRSNKRRNK